MAREKAKYCSCKKFDRVVRKFGKVYDNAREFWNAIDRGETGIELKAGVIKKAEILFKKIKNET